MIKGLSEFEKYKVIRPIIGECEYDNFGFPIIKKPDIRSIDWDNVVLKGVHNLSKRDDNSHMIVHMFRYDKNLISLWNNPLKKIALFRTCAAIATPDFSIYPNMNINDIRHNVYMSRWLGCTWQNYGVTVLPTIGWAGKETYEMCFSAVERGTPVIISTLGCQNHIEEFLPGFNAMKQQISPPIIVVVGDMLEGMTGKFLNFKYKDTFSQKHIQLKLDGFSSVFEIKEAV